MSKNIGKIIRVNSLPPKGERLTNVIYQVAVPETATYIDYAVDENGDIKTPTLDKSLAENDFSKVKTVNHQEPDENGNIVLNDYVQIYNSDEELQEIWDNGISDKVYFNHHTKEMVIGNSDGDGYSLFKMEEYLNKPDVTGTVQEYPYVVVVDNEGNSAKRSLEDFGKVSTVNNKEPDGNKNVDIGLDEVLSKGNQSTLPILVSMLNLVDEKTGYSTQLIPESVINNFSTIIIPNKSGTVALLEDIDLSNTVTVDSINHINPTEFSMKANNVNLTFEDYNGVFTYDDGTVNSITRVGTDEGVPLSFEQTQGNSNVALDLSVTGIRYKYAPINTPIEGYISYPNVAGSWTIPVKINDTYANEAGEININRFPDLEDKSQNVTYNKKVVLNSNGDAGVANDFPAEFVKIEQNDNIGYGTKYRADNPQFYGEIGRRSFDFSVADGSGWWDGTYEMGAINGDAIAIGFNVSASYGLAIGTNSIAAGANSVSIGSMSRALGQNSVALNGGIASTQSSTAIGEYSETKGFGSTAIGRKSITEESAWDSYAIGIEAGTTGKYSMALGFRNKAMSYASVILGPFATIDTVYDADDYVATDTAFKIGCGIHENARADAIKGLKNGLVTLPTITTALVDSNAKAVVTKEYLDIRIPKPPTTGNHVLKAVNGVVSWIAE
ncbi:hypothetical protein [Empedobacter brevis]